MFLAGGRIGRITGLDPSGPLFYSVTDDDRLDRSDARFVDIVHTAGHWVGTTRPSGHVDIWPNGGSAPQPGCENKESLDMSCSHFHAWKMFADSILSKNSDVMPLMAIKCNSRQLFTSNKCCEKDSVFAEVGEYMNTSMRGDFYLKTKSEPHFALPSINSTNCKHADLNL